MGQFCSPCFINFLRLVSCQWHFRSIGPRWLETRSLFSDGKETPGSSKLFGQKCTVFILFYSFLVSVIVCVRVFFECPPKPKPPNKHVLLRECTFSHRVYYVCGFKTNNMNNNLNDPALCLCKMDIDGPSPKVITSYI